ncbi:hypothetical protein BGZ72_004113 [Mortierella alpina]|nr:hypothetical protein BGZ72_004113 [Mortierella alpina]
MKLFRLDFGIKDRYRRGLADTSSRMHRSPQSETDPRHLAASPSSPSALFSAIASTSHARDEPMEQWNQFGSSALEAANAQPQAHRSHSRSSNGGGRGHHGQDYGYDDDQEDDHSNDGYMSSSSSSLSSGSLASCSSLSPSSSDDDDDDDYGDEDDDMQGGGGGGGGGVSSSGGDYSGDRYDTQENDLSGSNGKHARQRVHFDYYGGRREMSEHGGLLPAAPTPAIEPLSDREALEQEARRRRLERHADKRRKSLNGSQAPPEDLTKPALADPLVLELIREEAEKERTRQPREDEDGEDDEDDEEDDVEDDEDQDEEEEEESDEDEPGDNGDSSDDGRDSSSMDESDNDRDSDEYDFYRGYNQYPPQDRDHSGDEEDKEEDNGAATAWYPQYDYGAEADATLLGADDLYKERVHPLALPPSRNYSSRSAVSDFDECGRMEHSHHSPGPMDSEIVSSNATNAFTASPVVLEDQSSYHMLPAVIAHYWKKLTHPSDTSPLDSSCPSSSNSTLPLSPTEQS